MEERRGTGERDSGGIVDESDDFGLRALWPSQKGNVAHVHLATFHAYIPPHHSKADGYR
ncbi:hypothetical protein FIBSPDRAFT_861106, partial [Athelia psychrophila]